VNPKNITRNGDCILTEVLLNKSDLSIFNKHSLKYKLAAAEKDYLLAVVLKIVYGSSIGKKLVFKGGTAIHHCYLSQTRFSEDLDFSSLDKLISMKEVKSVFESQDFLEVKDEYVSEKTIQIERLKYHGPLGFPNSLKIDIDFAQEIILPPRVVNFKNPWKIKVRVNAMDVTEICAEKIRAVNERSRYRDFYDLFLLIKNFKFNMSEIMDLVRRKEARKPMSKRRILKNWDNAVYEREKELGSIYYALAIPDLEIIKMIKDMSITKER